MITILLNPADASLVRGLEMYRHLQFEVEFRDGSQRDVHNLITKQLTGH